jgi:ATP synthase F1 complex assembly factor 2
MHDESTRAQVREALLKYLDTDTIWYAFICLLRDSDKRFFPCSFRQDYPDTLVELQKKHWGPILSWARDTFEVEIHTFDSVLSAPQPAETSAKLDRIMFKLDPWQMSGMFAHLLSLVRC